MNMNVDEMIEKIDDDRQKLCNVSDWREAYDRLHGRSQVHGTVILPKPIKIEEGSICLMDPFSGEVSVRRHRSPDGHLGGVEI
jgi:hypothetical protein